MAGRSLVGGQLKVVALVVEVHADLCDRVEASAAMSIIA